MCRIWVTLLAVLVLFPCASWGGTAQGKCPVKVLGAVDLANQIYTGTIPFIQGGKLPTSLRKDYCKSVQEMIPDPKHCKCMKIAGEGFAERQFDVVFPKIQSLCKELGVELSNITTC